MPPRGSAAYEKVTQRRTGPPPRPASQLPARRRAVGRNSERDQASLSRRIALNNGKGSSPLSLAQRLIKRAAKGIPLFQTGSPSRAGSGSLKTGASGITALPTIARGIDEQSGAASIRRLITGKGGGWDVVAAASMLPIGPLGKAARFGRKTAGAPKGYPVRLPREQVIPVSEFKRNTQFNKDLPEMVAGGAALRDTDDLFDAMRSTPKDRADIQPGEIYNYEPTYADDEGWGVGKPETRYAGLQTEDGTGFFVTEDEWHHRQLDKSLGREYGIETNFDLSDMTGRGRGGGRQLELSGGFADDADYGDIPPRLLGRGWTGDKRTDARDRAITALLRRLGPDKAWPLSRPEERLLAEELNSGVGLSDEWADAMPSILDSKYVQRTPTPSGGRSGAVRATPSYDTDVLSRRMWGVPLPGDPSIRDSALTRAVQRKRDKPVSRQRSKPEIVGETSANVRASKAKASEARKQRRLLQELGLLPRTPTRDPRLDAYESVLKELRDAGIM